MSEAPKVIWVAGSPSECGQYFPSCVEAEGELGGVGTRYIRADAPELVELVAAVNDLGRAFDHARMVPRPGSGVGGMTIEANIRGSVYNGVDAWPIAEVRDALAQWEALTK